MPRRGAAPRRTVQQDPIYNSEMVHRLINKIMWDGKKTLAMKIVYEAFERVAEKTGKNALEVFDQALKNTMPLLEVRPRRVGGATYQVPIEVRAERRLSLSLRWLVQFARARSDRTMVEKVAGELMDAANNTGGAVKRRDEVHRMAEANRPFAHYRW